MLYFPAPFTHLQSALWVWSVRGEWVITCLRGTQGIYMLNQWRMCLRQGSQIKQKKIIFISNFTIAPLIIPVWTGRVIASKLKKMINQKWLPSLCNRIGPSLSFCPILFSGMTYSWVNEKMSWRQTNLVWILDPGLRDSLKYLLWTILSSCAKWGSYHASQKIVVIIELCINECKIPGTQQNPRNGT